VSEVVALNNKLNLLSPDLVYGKKNERKCNSDVRAYTLRSNTTGQTVPCDKTGHCLGFQMSLNNLPLSSWRTAYLAALLETDQIQVPSRIAEALAAIEERFRSPIEIEGIEYKSIDAARRTLVTLKAAMV
jgi:hypothetical protein